MINTWPGDRFEKRQALLDAVSSVADTVAGNVSFGEEHCYLHPDSWGAIHDNGLLSLKLPSELGGAEADPVTQLEVRSEERRVGKECRSRWSPYH